MLNRFMPTQNFLEFERPHPYYWYFLLINAIVVLVCHLRSMQVQEGGLKDKPGKSRDYYHTCYCLSGLSVCQYYQSEDDETPPLRSAVLGPYSNKLEPVHPLFNVVLNQYHEAHDFFRRHWQHIICTHLVCLSIFSFSNTQLRLSDQGTGTLLWVRHKNVTRALYYVLRLKIT